MLRSAECATLTPVIRGLTRVSIDLHKSLARKMDARHKAGHDEVRGERQRQMTAVRRLRRGLLARLVDRDVLAMRHRDASVGDD